MEKRKKKHVTFNLDLNIIYNMIKWNYAYREARKGCWEQMARNRERFKRRIVNTEIILYPVLIKHTIRSIPDK